MLRTMAPNLRVLFSSGYSTEQVTQIDAGVAFINKPYRPSELMEAIRKHLPAER